MGKDTGRTSFGSIHHGVPAPIQTIVVTWIFGPYHLALMLALKNSPLSIVHQPSNARSPNHASPPRVSLAIGPPQLKAASLSFIRSSPIVQPRWVDLALRLTLNFPRHPCTLRLGASTIVLPFSRLPGPLRNQLISIRGNLTHHAFKFTNVAISPHEA